MSSQHYLELTYMFMSVEALRCWIAIKALQTEIKLHYDEHPVLRGSCEEDGIPECKHCNPSRHAVSCATFKASGGFCNVQGFPFTLAERGLPVQHRMLQVKAHVHHIC